MNKDAQEQVILGIDPGTVVMGYGCILVRGSSYQLLEMGTLNLSKLSDSGLKLREIYSFVVALCEKFHPDHVALEAPFYGKNVQSMLKLGRAQGVAIAAALSREIPYTEYAPRKIKQSITGNGNASKEQVAYMLAQLFTGKELSNILDATDALAGAVCHAYQSKVSGVSSGVKSWSTFISQNPNRVK